MGINFSDGPSALPREALERAGRGFLDFAGPGLSVVEINHRSTEYERMHLRTRELLRELLKVPETHEVLILQGGTRQHFSLVPFNFLRPGQYAEYLITGMWARTAYEEAQFVGDVRIAGDSAEVDGRHRSIPNLEQTTFSAGASYVHLCSNNTVAGTQWREFPDTGCVPLVVDMTSDILSRQVDFSRIALAYAGAQNNLGPAGAVVIIVNKEFLDAERPNIPHALRYKTHAARKSLLYTPSSFSVYTMLYVLEHAVALGGVPAIQANNERKAARLYAALSRYPDIYKLHAEAEHRSVMNAVWTLHSEDATGRFLRETARRNMRGLKGHRSIGGVRASIYNWVPAEHVETLTEFVAEFAESDRRRKRSEQRVGPARRQLLLKVEYNRPSGFLSDYLVNLSDGGVRLRAELPVGERVTLRLSFPGLLKPATVDAVVRWSEPESDEGGGQSGLEFVELTEHARAWLHNILHQAKEEKMEDTTRIILLVQNLFLQEVYSQEMVNWAELQEAHLELVHVNNSTRLVEELNNVGAALTVIDIDGIETTGPALLERLRRELTGNCPLIFLGTGRGAAELAAEDDTSILTLCKPLDFGQLMETVGTVLRARTHNETVPGKITISA